MRLKPIAVACAALLVSAASAVAQDWPARNITLIVPFAAGGGIDTNARLQALALGEVLKQTVVVENIGAAGGTVGTARAAKAAPDGYTLLIGNSRARTPMPPRCTRACPTIPSAISNRSA
ncbi:MAG: tripartite tricarboxylate transporter substrate-binding protein [Hyphomicrobiaceae bacterium]